MDLIKERGESLANLKKKKENLENERERIMGNLDKVKAGDLKSLRIQEAERWVATDLIK